MESRLFILFNLISRIFRIEIKQTTGKKGQKKKKMENKIKNWNINPWYGI